MSSLHVVHVIDTLSLGGAERMLVELANRQCAEGLRVSVCMTRAAGLLEARLDARISRLKLGRQHRFAVRPLLRLARWSYAERVDVAHCHGRSSFSLVALLVALQMFRGRVVLHDHRGIDIDSRIPGWFRAASRYISAYVAVYQDQLPWAQSTGIPGKRIHLIPNAIDTAVLAQIVQAAGSRAHVMKHPSLVCIGGIRREKAVDVLLEAIALVPRKLKLFIVGGDADPAYAEQCRARARRADLHSRVEFLGQREDAMALASAAELAVHSARAESGPLVLAEYASLGIPFVSTRVGGIAHALEQLGIGRFVPPEEPAALACAIDEMLAIPAQARRDMAKAWCVAARKSFDISVAMPRWNELYEQIVRES